MADQGFDHYDKADTVAVDRAVEEASADDYDALLLPGGVGNPDSLRQDENAVQLARSFFEQGKPVAAICHAPWTLIEAGVVRDRRLTSYPSLQTDLRNAGASWVEKAREARERGHTPSEEQATEGASHQRRHLPGDADHEEKVESIRKGKQPMIGEKTPKVRPRSRGGNVHRS